MPKFLNDLEDVNKLTKTTDVFSADLVNAAAAIQKAVDAHRQGGGAGLSHNAMETAAGAFVDITHAIKLDCDQLSETLRSNAQYIADRDSQTGTINAVADQAGGK